MAAGRTPVRGILVFTIAALLASMFPLSGWATTQSQVNAACADSREQLDEYRAAQARFEDAALAYEEVLNDVERIERKQERVAGSVEQHSEQLEEIQHQIEEQAVEMYMRGASTSPGLILGASSVDQVLTTTEFLSQATNGGQRSIDELIATRSELGRFQADLDDTHQDLKVAESDKQAAMDDQESAMNAEQAAYEKLSGRCKTLTAKYDAERKAAAAAAKARASGSVQVGSFICPITPGRTSFINSWGFPRSGGRRHKGTDMFAAMGEPVYAVVSGTVRISQNALGGKAIWLTGGGHSFYYAHLSGYNISSGQSVSQGNTIGFVGNTGNAAGGPPHLHFGLRSGGGMVNPYPTLVGACG